MAEHGIARRMLDTVKDALYRAITTARGDSFAPVRFQKDLARRLNVALGSPLATLEELHKRRDALARLEALRGSKGAIPTAKAEPAPVMVYFEKDRNARELAHIEEALGAKKIAFTKLDVTGDEATLDFVMREAKCESDDLPVVFVAGTAFGGFRALVEADVSGALEKAVFGA
jgi:DNA-binding transcriptional MocR family regulator